MSDEAVPIAYTVLQPGTPVRTSDGKVFGTVTTVLAVEDMDVFDGIVVATDDGPRFVDAPQVGRIFTTYVETSLTPDQAAALAAPDPDQFQRIRPGDRVGASILSRLFGGKRR